MRLKIAVSVVRFRPWAPFAKFSRNIKLLFPALAARAVYSFARRSGRYGDRPSSICPARSSLNFGGRTRLGLSAGWRGEGALLDQAGDATEDQLQAERYLVDTEDDSQEQQQRAKPADNEVRAQHGEPVEE